MFFTYIIECQDGTYYTGSTGDISVRMKQHMEGKGASYTRTHKFKKLMYLENFDTRSGAMKREIEIKKMNRIKKMILIEKNRENTSKLLDDFYRIF